MRNLLVLGVLAMAYACKREPPKPKINRTTFEPVYRAGKALQAPTVVNDDLTHFTRLVIAFTNKLDTCRNRVGFIPSTPEERELLEKYAAALSAYQESQRLFAERSSFSNPMFRNTLVHTWIRGWDGVTKTTRNGPVADMADKYKIHTLEYGDENRRWLGIPEDSSKVVWVRAGELLDEANGDYVNNLRPGFMSHRLSDPELAVLESSAEPKVAALSGEVRRLRRLLRESISYVAEVPGTEELQAELEREVMAIRAEKKGP